MNITIDSIYNKSPQIVKNFLLSLYYIKTYNQRYGSEYKKQLQFLHLSRKWDTAQLEQYQNKKIREFLIFCYNNTIFYKQVFDKINFNPHEYSSKKDLLQIPYLDKSIISNRYNDIYPSSWLKKNKHIYKSTSGSTGTPLSFARTYDSEQRYYAKYDFSWQTSIGKKFKDLRVAFIAGHKIKSVNENDPPFWAYNHLSKTIYFSSYHMSSENIYHYLEKIKKYKPEVLAGYPSSISLIANYILNNDIEICVPHIFLSSENLSENNKNIINKAFGGKIYNFYGNIEDIGPTYECKQNMMHLIQTDNIVNEIQGEIFLTHFGNYAFPLINYKIDDILSIEDTICDCGAKGKIIKKIYGRNEDYVLKNDGTKVGRLDHIFKGVNNIQESQIIQNKVQEIIIRIVKNKNFAENDKKQIIKNASDRLGNNFEFKFEFVDRIPRTKNGKLKFVISNINE
tara:strand:+ start:7407 stop:8765 length:1359 start_codon:yes stop_codon:yes gene_type:complete